MSFSLLRQQAHATPAGGVASGTLGQINGTIFPEPGTSLVIEGGHRLDGEILLGGAKNAVLPLMICGLLTSGRLHLSRLPEIADVMVLADILRQLGADISWSDDANPSMTICGAAVRGGNVDNPLVSRIRASFLISGALLARTGKITLPLPGGDDIGLRPIGFHLQGFREMGAAVEVTAGRVALTAPRAGLHGAHIVLPFPSVGATENLMIAATLARGETLIDNAAREPEVSDLAKCLRAMGARVDGVGTKMLCIQGVADLSDAAHRVIPDRIELGTYLCACAMVGGGLTFPDLDDESLGGFATWAARAGVVLQRSARGLTACRADAGLQSVSFITEAFPGFASDMQAQAMALLCVAPGVGQVTETLFENRFRHVPELRRMGAAISVDGRTATVVGVDRLTAARVTATDVRAGAALVIAALVARGTSEIRGIDHILRGYERLVEKLAACGAVLRFEKASSAL